MKIRYTKDGSPSVSFNGVLYRFTPDCEVEEQAAIDHLLADDSYVAVDNKPDKVGIPLKPEKTVKTKDNPLKCKECGKTCKSEFGLMAHLRSHK